MMTRDEVAKLYEVSTNGIVKSPGKFEGEPWYVVALWDAVLDGVFDRLDYDEVDCPLSSFNLDPEIMGMIQSVTHVKGVTDARFAGSSENAYITLWEDDTGFVRHLITRKAFLDSFAEEDGE